MAETKLRPPPPRAKRRASGRLAMWTQGLKPCGKRCAAIPWSFTLARGLARAVAIGSRPVGSGQSSGKKG